jgi:hypothetical protein
VSVSGFDVRLGVRLRLLSDERFSIGATLDLEFLRLARSSVAILPTDSSAASDFRNSASSLGLTVTARRRGAAF